MVEIQKILTLSLAMATLLTKPKNENWWKKSLIPARSSLNNRIVVLELILSTTAQKLIARIQMLTQRKLSKIFFFFTNTTIAVIVEWLLRLIG